MRACLGLLAAFATFQSQAHLARAQAPAAPAPANRFDPYAKPQVPTVFVVGCAVPGASPEMWLLQRASDHSSSTGPAFTEPEYESLPKAALGTGSYELIGIADFVTNDKSLEIGQRRQLYTTEQANASGALRPGARVAVKGLLLPHTPYRINVTAVRQIDAACPAP